MDKYYNKDVVTGEMGDNFADHYEGGFDEFVICELEKKNVDQLSYLHEAEVCAGGMSLEKCVRLCVGYREVCGSVLYLQDGDSINQPDDLCVLTSFKLVNFPDYQNTLKDHSCENQDYCDSCNLTRSNKDGVSACDLRDYIADHLQDTSFPIIPRPGAAVVFMPHVGPLTAMFQYEREYLI